MDLQVTQMAPNAFDLEVCLKEDSLHPMAPAQENTLIPPNTSEGRKSDLCPSDTYPTQTRRNFFVSQSHFPILGLNSRAETEALTAGPFSHV